MKVEIKNGKLYFEIDVNDPPLPSKSGKSLIVASTYGIAQTPALVNGKPVMIGFNAYVKNN